MTIEELIEKIKELKKLPEDPESTHGQLDDLLLEYINNKEVTELFCSFTLWYS